MAFGRDRSFRPLPGRYGAMVVVLTKPTTDLTANVTNTFNVGAPVGDSRRPAKSKLLGVTVSAITVPVDADGTILASVIKFRASDDVDVTLSSATLDLEALTAAEQSDFTLVENEDDVTFERRRCPSDRRSERLSSNRHAARRDGCRG